MEVQTAVEAFLKIDGSSASEIEKGFQSFLRENQMTPELLRAMLTSSKTSRHSCFCIRLVGSLSLEDQIIEILKNQVKDLKLEMIKRLPSSFLSQADPQEVVNSKFPEFSFTVRKKLINWLSKKISTEKADVYFESLKSRYGQSFAMKILPFCSYEKIQETLKNSEIALNRSDQLTIQRRFPQFLDYLYEKAVKGAKNMTACFDLKFFLQNKEKFTQTVHGVNIFDLLSFKPLGKSSSKKVILELKDLILENPLKFRFLNLKAIAKYLNIEEMETFYSNSLAKNIENCNLKTFSFEILKKEKVETKFQVVSRGFKKRYAIELIEHPQLAYTVAEILPLTEREALYEKMITGRQELDYIHLLEHSKAFETVKKIISMQKSWEDRQKLINSLLICCKTNGNKEGLVPVLEYVLARHSNEIPMFHLQVLSSLINLFKENYQIFGISVDILEFPDDLWKLLETHLNLVLKNSTDGDRQTYVYQQILRLFIDIVARRLSKNENFQDLLDIYSREVNNLVIIRTNLLLNLPSLREVLIRVPSTEKSRDLMLLKEVLEFNNIIAANHPDLLIKVFENHSWMIKALIQSLESRSNWDDSFYFKLLLKTESQSELKSELWEKFWEYRVKGNQKFYDSRFFFDLLKKLPAELERKSDHFGECNCSLNSGMINRLRRPENSKIMLKLNNYFTQIIEKGDIENNNGSFLISKALKWFAFDAKFLSTIQPFTPKGEWLKNSTDYRASVVRNQVPGLFKFYNRHEQLLSIIHEYLTPEMMKFSIGGLNAIMNNVSEEKVEETVSLLLKERVGVKKHGIYLATKLLSLERAFSIMTQAIAGEKNKSICSQINLNIFRCFCESQTDSFFELLKKQIQTINSWEEFQEKELFLFEKIPKRFAESYIKTVWELAKRTGWHTIRLVLNNYNEATCGSFNQTISDEIAYFAIVDVESMNNEHDYMILNFCLFYLGFANQKLNNRCLKFKDFIEGYWNDGEKVLVASEDQESTIKRIEKTFGDDWNSSQNLFARTRRAARIYSIFSHISDSMSNRNSIFCNPLVNKDCFARNIQVLIELLSVAESLNVSLEEKFGSIRVLKHAIICNELYNDKNLEGFAKKVTALFEESVREFGVLIVSDHSLFLKDYFTRYIVDQNNAIVEVKLIKLLKLLADTAIDDENSQHCFKVLLVGLLPKKDQRMNIPVLKEYQDLIDSLMKGDPFIKYLIFKKLSSIE